MPYGRWPRVSRDEVIGALDCAWCRTFVEQHATDPVDLHAPRRVDLGGAAAYGAAKHYGGPGDHHGYPCAACRRVIVVEEIRGTLWTYMPLDRDLVGS